MKNFEYISVATKIPDEEWRFFFSISRYCLAYISNGYEIFFLILEHFAL